MSRFDPGAARLSVFSTRHRPRAREAGGELTLRVAELLLVGLVELLLLITVVPHVLSLPALPHRPHDDPGVGRVSGTLRYHVARAADEHQPGPGAGVVEVVVGVAHLVVEVVLLRHSDPPLDRGLDDAPRAPPLCLSDVGQTAPVTSAAAAAASPHTPRGRGQGA